ncbi:MAG: alpha/beta hydrolase-fold protein [Anaerolineae bacterium]|nr:alpha/beta hydrolase-fold protein [Anaerolineae bacterium]
MVGRPDSSDSSRLRLKSWGSLLLLALLVLIGATAFAASQVLSPSNVSAKGQAERVLNVLPKAALGTPLPPLSAGEIFPSEVLASLVRAAPTVAPPPTPTPRPTVAQAAAADVRARFATCPTPHSQIVTEVIESQVTPVPIVVHVYLPPCYDPEHYAYPTLYLIHGTAYEQGGWFVHGLPQLAEVQMSIGTLPPFVIVMPGADMRAGENSRYSWTNRGKGSYADFLVNELIPFIESRYSVMPTREGRAIGGISRGGYWAIHIAFARPDLFSAVGGHSPSVYTMLVDVPANFSMLSAAASTDSLRALRIWIDAGDEDWARVDAKKLASDLDDANVPYTLDIGRGAHVDEYWTDRLPEYLAFYAERWSHELQPKLAHP